MSDKLQNQLRIAEKHYNSIPTDLRNIYEAEYSAASAAYRPKADRPSTPHPKRSSGAAAESPEKRE